MKAQFITKGWLLFLGLCLILSCSKDREDEEKDDLPVLDTCKTMDALGGLKYMGGDMWEFQSASGTIIKLGKQIHEDQYGLTATMTFQTFPGRNDTYQMWGGAEIENSGPYNAAYENLNGKYIKNRIGNSRTLIFPDGIKITFVSAGPAATITAISIYDGANMYHFNITCDTVEYSASNGAIAKQLEAMQADGETSEFEFTDTHVIMYNSYMENIPGQKIYERVDLGSLEKDNPKQINDLYDDPRVDFT